MAPRASRPNSPRHGPVKPLGQLVLLNCHWQSLPVQELLLIQHFPLRPPNPLALWPSLPSIFLCHANELVTHFSKSNFAQNPPLFSRETPKIRRSSWKLKLWSMQFSFSFQTSRFLYFSNFVGKILDYWEK